MRINQSRGYYFGRYKALTSLYDGADFSKICFIFPGQGAAFPKMFREQYLAFPMMRERFELADLLAKENNLTKISDYLLAPEKIKQENLPITRNLALFVAEVAIFELLISRGVVPEIITGHSFGEYAVLVVAGVVSFEKMFEIICFREQACPAANVAGFMLAVNTGANELNRILAEDEFHISNLNSYQQTVLSARPEKVERIQKKLVQNNLKFKLLQDVPQPYHCPYLKEVQVKLKEYFQHQKIEFRKPKLAFFSSVSQKLIDASNFTKADIEYILVNQITAPVNFIAQISEIHALRCFNFVELGERKTFTSFVENILGGEEIKTDFATNLLSAKFSQSIKSVKNINQKDNKLFALVNKVIGEITGYEIDKISLEDRFQEDLGIDSIKKADILLTVLDESKINPGEEFNTSNFSSINDTVEYLKQAQRKVKIKSVPILEKQTFFDRYCFVWQPKEILEVFLLPAQRQTQLVVQFQEIFITPELLLEKLQLFLKENSTQNPNIIIVANGVEFEYAKIALFFNFWKSFLAHSAGESSDLTLVVFGEASPMIKGCVSFLRSMKKEVPALFFKCIHFETRPELAEILEVVGREMREPFEIEVFYKNNQRLISVREKAEKKITKLKIDKNFVILAIGGAKGISLALLRDIARSFDPIIFLVGRSSAEDLKVQSGLAGLKKIVSNVFYESLDACDFESLEKLFAKIKKQYGRIDLVLNAAGVVVVSFIQEKGQEEMERELRNKILPAVNVLKLAEKNEVKKVINFSSVVSKYGGAGQSIYAMANEIVAGLTMQYKFGAVMHWPPWDGVGMTAQQGILKNLTEQGVSLLQPQKATKLFLADLARVDLGEIYYMDRDDDVFYGFSLLNFRKLAPLLGKLKNSLNISMAEPIFEKKFGLIGDVYLDDHQISGNSYVPAAVGIGMFFCLASAYDRRFPILEKIIIHNPLIVKKELVPANLEVKRVEKRLDFSIKSSVLNFSGQVNRFSEKISKETHIKKKAQKEISKSSIYCEKNAKQGLYLGPIFQNIEKAFLDEEGNAFFRLNNADLLPVLGLGFYDKFIQWIDASFQALSYAVGFKNGYKFIPVGVSKIATFFDSEITNYLLIYPTINEFSSDEANGNVVIINEKNEIIIEMEGIVLKSIARDNENRLKIVEHEKN